MWRTRGEGWRHAGNAPALRLYIARLREPRPVLADAVTAPARACLCGTATGVVAESFSRAPRVRSERTDTSQRIP